MSLRKTNYQTEYSAKENALRVHNKIREQEKQKEHLVKQGLMKKVVTYDPKQRLTRIKYIKL